MDRNWAHVGLTIAPRLFLFSLLFSTTTRIAIDDDDGEGHDRGGPDGAGDHGGAGHNNFFCFCCYQYCEVLVLLVFICN